MEHQELKSHVGKKATVIWDAYQEVLAELKKKEGIASTTAVSASKRKAQAINMAEKVNIDDVGEAVENLVAGLQEAKATFLDLKEAIDAKKKELKEVHDLEAEVNSLVAVMATKDKLVKDREEYASEILKQAKDEVAVIIKKANEEANAIAEASKAKSIEDEKARKRIQDEWEYSFQRSKKAKIDLLADEIDSKNKQLTERELAISLREEKQEEVEAEIEELKDKLLAAENATTDLIEAAVAKAKASADKSFAFQKQLIEKEYKGQLAVLESDNKSLHAQVVELSRRLDRAENQVQAANDKVTAIATGALQAAGDKATIAKVSEIAAGSQSKK